MSMELGIFERRVNDVELNICWLQRTVVADTHNKDGQTNFVAKNPGGDQFTASATLLSARTARSKSKLPGASVTDPGDDPSRYYTQLAFVAFPGPCHGGQQFCSSVMLGSGHAHYPTQPVDPQNPKLLPQWIWATFEHVDNAPMAQTPCNVANGCGTNPATNWINQPSCGPAAPSTSVRYSFYKQNSGVQGTNVRPVSTGSGPTKFPWNAKQPYAQGNTTAATAKSQANALLFNLPDDRFKSIRNVQSALAAFKTPLQNYMLVGTQWGGNVEPREGNPLPADAVPAMLSNLTLETYIQNYTKATSDGGTWFVLLGGHAFAKMAVGNRRQRRTSAPAGIGPTRKPRAVRSRHEGEQ